MGCLLLAACSDDGVETSGTEPGGSDNEDVGNNPPSALTGYADPDGVMILSGGTYTLENAFLTFINPEGEVENKVYAGANSSELGNDGVALYLCDGKQYILCNDWYQADGRETILPSATPAEHLIAASEVDYSAYRREIRNLREHHPLFEERLERFYAELKCRPQVLDESLKYSLKSGGKRVRPVLMLAAADLVGAI